MSDRDWKQAVNDELVISLQCTTDYYDDPKKAIKDLIDWHVQVATDPQCNGGYELVEKDQHKISTNIEKAKEHLKRFKAMGVPRDLSSALVALESGEQTLREVRAEAVFDGWMVCAHWMKKSPAGSNVTEAAREYSQKVRRGEYEN